MLYNTDGLTGPGTTERSLAGTWPGGRRMMLIDTGASVSDTPGPRKVNLGGPWASFSKNILKLETKIWVGVLFLGEKARS